MYDDDEMISTDFNFLGTPEGVDPPAPLVEVTKPYTKQEINYVARLVESNGRSPQKAAKLAGYSNGVAREAYKWIRMDREKSSKPHLWDLYQQQLEEARAGLEISTERILEEYACVAFFDPARLFDERTNEIKPIHQIDPYTRKAINKIKYRTDAEGTPNIEVSFVDKRGSLDSLARILGMLKENVVHEHTFTQLMDSLRAGDEPLVISQEDVKEIASDV